MEMEEMKMNVNWNMDVKWKEFVMNHQLIWFI